jgi:hypothetical protein
MGSPQNKWDEWEAWRTPKLVIRLKCEFEGENNKKRRCGDTLLNLQHFGDKRLELCLAMGVAPKCHFVANFPKLGLLRLWRPIIFCANLRLGWDLKQNYSHFCNLSKIMWHATWVQVNHGNSQLLVIRSQIGILTSDPSFGHNLCFEYSNESCNPI